MTFTEQPVVAAALLMATIFVSACSIAEECSSKGTMSITLRADRPCPSAREAQTRVDSELPEVGTSIDSEARTRVDIRARVVCWYRSTEASGITPCFWGTRAAMLVNATRPEQTPDDGPATYASYLLSCDDEGSLYGQVIFVSQANASDALPATPVECPAEVVPAPTAADKLIAVTTFVGSDEYPARVTCEYDTTERYSCAWDELSH
jgi:hypothetical protein